MLFEKECAKMVSRSKRMFAVINYPRTVFAYLCVLCSPQKHFIEKDLKRWREIDGIHMGLFETLNWYLTYKKEFRNLLLHRLKHPSYTPLALLQYFITRLFWKPMESLYIYTQDIGGGLYIQHGFSTIISAKKIGENCRIYQQVTIGYKEDANPVLEDGVAVTCGAKVLGDVTMHKGSLAAAGAVVVKDVPENAIVGGIPAKVIGYKEENNLDFQG